MALCSSGPNPAATITNGLQLFMDSPWGEDGGFPGDYSVAGVGTRKTGGGVIKLKNIPSKTIVTQAFLIYNTYQANSPVAHPTVTLNGTAATGSLYGICNSTCWYNPPFEATTYLRNRVYIRNVGPSGLDLVKGNGDYVVAGLINSPAMRIGTDGDRIPGCRSSQGAILFVIWEYDPDIAPSENFKTENYRAINMYLGARLLSNNPTFGLGLNSYYNLAFNPVQDTTDKNYFKGNTHIEVAAGDTQNSVPGDSFAINQVRFATPNNAFTKIGSSLCVRKFSVAQIYDGENSAFARTTNDCIDWFFFVISGDKTQPKSQFQIVTCAATWLLGGVSQDDTSIIVYSNFVQDIQTITGGECRAVKYQPPLVLLPGVPPPPRTPGMFPTAQYYIKVDNEIMKVKDKRKGNQIEINTGLPPLAAGQQDLLVWDVERGQSGTVAVAHPAIKEDGQKTCVYMLAPPRFIRDMQAGLAPRGPGNQRQNAGAPAAEQERR